MVVAVVDPYPIDLFITTKLIQSYLPRIQLVAISNSKEAIDFICGAVQYDVLLIDMDFLTMIEFDLLTKLRATNPLIAIYGTSSFVGAQELQLAKSCHLNGAFEKPISKKIALKIAKKKNF